MSKVDYRNFYPLLPPWQITTPPTDKRRFWHGPLPAGGFWTRQRKRQQHRALAKETRSRHAGRR